MEQEHGQLDPVRLAGVSGMRAARGLGVETQRTVEDVFEGARQDLEGLPVEIHGRPRRYRLVRRRQCSVPERVNVFVAVTFAAG